MKLARTYFPKINWFIFALIVYFCLSVYSSPRIGLGSGEFNMDISSPFYPLVVTDIVKDGDVLVDEYAVPVPGFFSGARINRIGPLEMIRTVVEPEYLLRISKAVFPVMKNKYTGALAHYYVNFFNLFGNNKVFLVHFASIFLGAVIIILTAYLSYLFLGRKVAITCALLLSTNPLFIIFKRLPAFPEHFTELFSIGILTILLLFLKTQRNRYFYFLSFLVGLAIYQKVTIFWTLSAIFVIAFVFRLGIKLRLKQLILGFIFFLIGIFPLILYNFLDSGTISFSTSFFLGDDFLKGLTLRISDWFGRFIYIFGDPIGFFRYLFYGVRAPAVNYFFYVLLFASFLFPVFTLLKKKPWIEQKKVAFFPLLLVLMLFSMSIINRSGFDFTHTFLLVPVVAIVESTFLVHLLEILEKIIIKYIKLPFKRYLYFILIILVLLFQTSQVCEYYFEESKDSSPVMIMVDAHKELVKYLLNEKITHPVTTNFNLMGIVEFLSQEKVMPIYYWIVWKDAEVKDNALGRIILKNLNGYYILKVGFKVDIFNVFPEPSVANFLEVAEKNNVKPVLLRNIHSRNGTLMFSIYKLGAVNI